MKFCSPAVDDQNVNQDSEYASDGNVSGPSAEGKGVKCIVNSLL